MTAPPVLVPVLDCEAADSDEVILSDVSSAAAEEVMLPEDVSSALVDDMVSVSMVDAVSVPPTIVFPLLMSTVLPS